MSTNTGDYRPGNNPSENPADNPTPPAPPTSDPRPHTAQIPASDSHALNLIEGAQ